MKKSNIKILAIGVSFLIMLLGSTSAMSINPDTQQKKENGLYGPVPYGDGNSQLYKCMLICGYSYIIIVTTLAYVAQGMSFAAAALLAGATLAMVACVLMCIESSQQNPESECLPCGQQDSNSLSLDPVIFIQLAPPSPR